MKVFDIHAHIYPDSIAQRAVENIGSAYDGVEILNDGRLDTLLARSATAGVTRTAVHSVATTAHQVDSINRFILKSAQDHPERLIPFAALHPDTPGLEEKVIELAETGFRGVKLHPEFQGFQVDEPRALTLLRAIGGRLPVLLHCGDPRCDHSAAWRIRAAVEAVPEVRLVCAHLGGWTTWTQAAPVLAGTGVWVDTSSSLDALDASAAVDLIRGYGADQVVFGTDYPVWRPGEELAKLLALPLTDEEREKILWTNHMSLLGDNI